MSSRSASVVDFEIASAAKKFVSGLKIETKDAGFNAYLRAKVYKAIKRGKSRKKAAAYALKKHGFPIPWETTSAKPAPPAVKSDAQPEVKLEAAKHADPKSLAAAVDMLRRSGFDVTVRGAAPVKDADGLRRMLVRAVDLVRSELSEADAVLRSLDTAAKMSLIGDCRGVLLDARKSSCASCPDVAECAHTFAVEARAGFPKLREKLGPPKSVVQNGGRARKGTFSHVRWDPDVLLDVSKDPNPNEPGTAGYEFLEEVLARGTLSMADLRTISLKHFGRETDEDFAKVYVQKLLEARVLFLHGADPVPDAAPPKKPKKSTPKKS